MPRHSPFRIELTRDERRALEARARKYTSPYRDVIRAKLVLLAADGLSNDVIAARLDTPAPNHQQVAQALLSTNDSRASRRSREAGVQPAFPPNVVVEVKRIACERPMDAGVPVARWSLPDLRREVLARGLVATISGTTLWRWLDADAIRPWRHRSWLFPRDPRFAERAGPILDLYHRRWEGRPSGPHDYVISADEKTSIQARAPPPRADAGRRRPPPARRARVSRGTARGPIWPRGTCTARACLDAASRDPASPPFDRLVDDVMTQEPYRSARRVFWIMDNGSAHRGAKGDARLAGPLAHAASGAHSAARELVEPDRDLLLDRAAQGPDAERFRDARPPWNTICSPFNTAIRPRRGRSAGPSIGRTCSSSSPNWPRCGRPHDRNTSP